MKFARLFGSILLNLIAFNAAMFAGCAISGNDFQFNLFMCVVVPVIIPKQKRSFYYEHE